MLAVGMTELSPVTFAVGVRDSPASGTCRLTGILQVELDESPDDWTREH